MKKLSIYSFIFLLFTATIPAFLGASEASQGDSKSAAALETVAISTDDSMYLNPIELAFAKVHEVPASLKADIDKLGLAENPEVVALFKEYEVQRKYQKQDWIIDNLNKRYHEKFEKLLSSVGFKNVKSGFSHGVYSHDAFPSYIFKMGLSCRIGKINFMRVTCRECIAYELTSNTELREKLRLPQKYYYLLPIDNRTWDDDNILFEHAIVVAQKINLEDGDKKLPSTPIDIRDILQRYGINDFACNIVRINGVWTPFDLGGTLREKIRIPRPTFDAIQVKLAKRGTKPQKLTDLELSIYPKLTSAECAEYSKLTSNTACIKFLLERDPTSKIYERS